MKLIFKTSRLDTNHHKRWKEDGQWKSETQRSCIDLVPLGRDSWLQPVGRRIIGRRLWVYGPSGACRSFDLYLFFDQCPYPAGTRYGPRPTVCMYPNG